MFLLRVIQLLAGYASVRAENGAPEKLLNLAARQGVALWNIRAEKGTLFFCVPLRSLSRVRALAKQAGAELTVERRRGLPMWLGRLKKRAGLLAGTGLFLALVWFFSSFVWEIDISGNTGVPTAQIEQELEKLGLRPGAFSALLQRRVIQSSLLLHLPELSGVTINIHGSVAYVEVRERRYPPEVVPDSQPCNVKASVDGQIIHLSVLKGQPTVKDGDAVTAGQLLITGVVEAKDGTVRTLHAQGTALARTKRELRVTVPYLNTVRKETGQETRRYTLEIFGYGVPLFWGALEGDYDRYASAQNLVVFGQRLPLGVQTAIYRTCAREKVRYTPAQAQKQAEQELAEQERTELSNVKIISREVQVQTDAAGCTLTAQYVCEEDIAVSDAILIS